MEREYYLDLHQKLMWLFVAVAALAFYVYWNRLETAQIGETVRRRMSILEHNLGLWAGQFKSSQSAEVKPDE